MNHCEQENAHTYEVGIPRHLAVGIEVSLDRVLVSTHKPRSEDTKRESECVKLVHRENVMQEVWLQLDHGPDRAVEEAGSKPEATTEKEEWKEEVVKKEEGEVPQRSVYVVKEVGASEDTEEPLDDVRTTVVNIKKEEIGRKEDRDDDPERHKDSQEATAIKSERSFTSFQL